MNSKFEGYAIVTLMDDHERIAGYVVTEASGYTIRIADMRRYYEASDVYRIDPCTEAEVLAQTQKACNCRVCRLHPRQMRRKRWPGR